jgi:hypothetical protein
MKNNLNTTFESFHKKPRSKITRGYRQLTQTDLYQQVVGFTCMSCKQIINSDPLYSGVNNRNHCPYCLTSKHVDLYRAGDRLNACKSRMTPIGLTWKRTKNKYGSGLGELMIIHRCDGCHQLSINRIAADDCSDSIHQLFYDSINLPEVDLSDLVYSGIELVKTDHKSEILASLFGNSKY